MKLTVVLAVLIGMLVLACSAAAPTPAEPTPNIDATVEAKLAQERAVDATAQAKTLSTTQASCKLTGGETVESGWTGEDTGDNSCNSCFCTNGALGCTKMACPAHLVNSDAEPAPTAVPAATSVPTPTPRPIPTLTAKQRLISIGFNVPLAVPFSEAEQEYVASLDIPIEYRERFIEVQNNLNIVLGAYPNYIYVAFNPEGTEEDAQPVYDRLTNAKFRGYEDGYTVDELTNIKSCLTGSDPGGARSSTTNQLSLCIEDLPFIENPFSSDPSVELERRHAKMTLHLAHEYFHHYQRAHALDRGLDHQADRSNPSTTVQAPRWWTEGAAVTFQNAWYQANWQSLSFVNDSSGVYSIASVATSDDYKRVRTTIMGGIVSEQEKRANSCPSDWYMTSDDNLSMTCEGAMLATAFMAYKSSYKTVWIDIPQDYYDLGFWGAVKKHLGFTEQEFFDEYNGFMRSGDPGDEPPAGWAPPEGPISAYADFLQIIPESDPVDAKPHY